MRGLNRLIMLLPFLLAAVQAADLIDDLATVQGMERFKESEAAKALLKKNGFVVVPRYCHQIFTPYLDMSQPHFVTADSVHRTFHAIFEDVIKKGEVACAWELSSFTKQMREALEKLAVPDDDARALARHVFHISECLLAENLGKDLPPPVTAELNVIQAAAGVAVSPLFGYAIDYSLCKPRGFYTGTLVLERYFRAVSWYAGAAFRLNCDKETRAAMLIARVFGENKACREQWQKLDRLYTFFLAPCDDLTPADYAAVLKQTGPDAVRFKDAADKLRDPKINSMALSPEQMHNWRKLTKGLRVFGSRYIPDSEIIMHLTDPETPGRGFPSGLDILAANGSTRAKALQAGESAKWQGYAEALAQSAARLADLKKSESPSHYVRFLKVLETLSAPPQDKAAAFTKTPAYSDKNVMTSLACWASMRHTWQLHAKQSSICLGEQMAQRSPGYVEPNPAFFKVLKQLSKGAHEALTDLGLDIGRFSDFEKLLDELSAVVDKELAGQPFTDREISLLERYGYCIAELQGFHLNHDADKELPWMALVADVHTEHLSQACLEAGTGGAMPIYAVAEHQGKLHLMCGGVYSYREFTQPLAKRLTDEGWRELWQNGRMPPALPWMQSFIPGEDVDTLIERARKGERVPGFLYVNDAKLDAFLEKAIQPGGELEGKANYAWALDAATAKLGRKVQPFLMKLLREGRVEKGQFVADDDHTGHMDGMGTADAALEALARVLEEADIPALVEVAKGAEEMRARIVVYMTRNLSQPLGSDILVAILCSTADELVREAAAFELAHFAGARDLTPRLLELWPRNDWVFRAGALDILKEAWDTRHDKLRPGPQCSAEDIGKWQKAVRAVVVQALADENERVRRKAAELAAQLPGEWNVDKPAPKPPPEAKKK
ncbi:MAG: DUF3160 domain-containing protein [Planctomycetota bacterium]